MSKNTSDQTDEQQSGGEEDITRKSLDTVRDILFGEQARETDKRTRQLEDLIKKSVSDLSAEFQQQIKGIEKTIDSLKNQIDKDNTKNNAQVADKFDGVSQDLLALAKKTQTEMADLQDQTSNELQQLEKTAAAWNEDLAKQLEQVHQQLGDSKTDRHQLANLLSTMAASLAGDKDANDK